MSSKAGQLENIKFPWFKKRLKTKYLRDLRQKQQLSGALDSRKWRFLSPGLDDFRAGYPTVHKELFTQRKAGLCPAVFGMPNHACSVRSRQERLSKNQACFSKHNPRSEAQCEFIDAVEHKLKQHPLALYPHLESGMTPELFEQVLSVLDSDMCVKGEMLLTSPSKKMEPPEAPSITIRPPKDKSKDARPRNPYKWQGLKEALGDKEDQTAIVNNLHSVVQENDEQMITKLFCEWITSLGGETSDLTESTILDLFKSDYGKKATSLPNNKVDPNSTPVERYSSVEEHPKEHCIKELTKAYKPNNTQPANGPLRALVDYTTSEEQLSEQDKELKQFHGIQAFREFLLNKGVRMPRFLSAVFAEEEQKSRTRGSTSSSKRKDVH